MLRIKTTYPGQEPRELIAPLYMVRNIALFRKEPPFVDVVGLSKALQELTDEEAAFWPRLVPLLVDLKLLGG